MYIIPYILHTYQIQLEYQKQLMIHKDIEYTSHNQFGPRDTALRTQKKDAYLNSFESIPHGIYALIIMDGNAVS